MPETHADEIRAGRRFPFGRNWRSFLSVLDDERIEEAKRSLRAFLEVDSLAGRSFLDVGSGSGLFSLAARRLGASVLSFDYDPDCVECTRELRRRYYPDDPDWRVMEGSVLDETFVRSLGQFDVVYAWGVLHHTGDMWRAIAHLTSTPAVGGRLFMAIYNDDGASSRRWQRRKRRFNRLPAVLRAPYAVAVWAPFELLTLAAALRRGRVRAYVDLWRHYKQSRGMSRWHDIRDWLGGYPFEFASMDALVTFLQRANFKPLKLVPSPGHGCHQLVLERG
jgi:SAM-dependent methyltransferase